MPEFATRRAPPAPTVYSKLIVRKGGIPKGKQELVLDWSKRSFYVIGRVAGADLVIVDPLVSRVHAILTWDGNHWYIHDLNSGNGVWVGGSRLHDGLPKTLTPGCEVFLACEGDDPRTPMVKLEFV